MLQIQEGFGKNIMTINNEAWLSTIIYFILSPLGLFEIFAISIFLYNGYLLYSLWLLTFLFIEMWTQLSKKLTRKRDLQTLCRSEDQVMVIRRS